MFARIFFALAGFGLAANAHLFMYSPVPIEGSAPKDPLEADGSNFPCHGVTLPTSGGQSMAIGSKQTLAFDLGSGANTAVHGGGSCQISVTYETDPTAIKDPSNWKVIYSIEEGCPTNSLMNLDLEFAGHDGTYTGSYPCNDSSTNGFDCVNSFDFTLPEGLQNGHATLAWTWFNNVGNREMYMNCANIEVSGGASDASGLADLPSMFVANLAGDGLPDCDTTAYSNVKFPNPGKYVTTKAATTNMAVSTFSSYPLAVPTGAGCAADGGSAAAGSGSAQTTAVGSSAAASSDTPTLSSFVQAGVASQTTLATATSAAAAAATSASSDSSSTSSSDSSSDSSTSDTSSSNSTGSTGSCASGSVTCTTPGAVTCIGSDQWGMCNIDNCAVPMALAAGTVCENGVIGAASGKRNVGKHLRSHRRVSGGVHSWSF
ncbi:hypothetical protein M8818_005281 [Zalaria obscura]|uniref:Uncharacterized protein n=1 Tax=Zalaria obscura TaxID=2024903 RepID=A0ACC3SA08_9PEZI